MPMSVRAPSATAAVRLPRTAAHAARQSVRPSGSENGRPDALVRLIDAAIVGLMLMAVVSLFTLSGEIGRAHV